MKLHSLQIFNDYVGEHIGGDSVQIKKLEVEIDLLAIRLGSIEDKVKKSLSMESSLSKLVEIFLWNNI